MKKSLRKLLLDVNLCETNLAHSSHSAVVYLLLIWKDSVNPMNGLAVYVKEGLIFAQNLSLGNSSLCFQLLSPFIWCLT